MLEREDGKRMYFFSFFLLEHCFSSLPLFYCLVVRPSVAFEKRALTCSSFSQLAVFPANVYSKLASASFFNLHRISISSLS